MQIYLEGSINGGTPIAHWMVYFMENPIEMEDFSGYPYFRKPPFGCV